MKTKIYIALSAPFVVIGVVTVAIGFAMRQDPEWDGKRFTGEDYSDFAKEPLTFVD